MRRIAVRSVIVGGVVDVFASSFLGAVSVVFVLLLLSIAHTPADRTSGIVSDVVRGNPWYLAAQLVIGGACSVLGGYIAARLARHDERLNGALSSFACVGSGIVALAVGYDRQQAVLEIAMLPLAPLLGFAGGYLRERQRRERGSFRPAETH